MTEHNYADKTDAELDELEDYYFRLHAEARRAFRETGNAYWDKTMQEYMAELRAIDKEQMARTAGESEATEVAL